MNILIIGKGSMGNVLAKEVEMLGYNSIISRDLQDIYLKENKKFDVIIDFSHTSNLDNIFEYSKLNKTPVVIATTGFNNLQFNKIKELTKYIPVLYSANYSMGIILLNQVSKQVSKVLKDFDIEIIEKHHKYKIDSPSGTTKMLLNSICENNEYKISNGRVGEKKRTKEEIGVHSIRGGSIVGEHEILFIGEEEIFSIKHEASSKSIFAKGAIIAAKWLIGKENKLYNMVDVLENLKIRD
ncbi:MAG: 4-hydroxy-tetrahydrodipicolinate reductase [Defluviitaleaceae bacterium]|nr:4-hydroxy-tetrahydrodipicolinate reductase [Defluviitaleaceae bacterium]